MAQHNRQWMYFSFHGRLPRKPFWISTITLGLLAFIVSAMGNEVVDSNSDAGAFIFLILLLVMLYIALALNAKRLHDSGHSGLWILIQLIPGIGTLVLFVLLCFPSTPGPNQYGDNPYDHAHN